MTRRRDKHPTAEKAALGSCFVSVNLVYFMKASAQGNPKPKKAAKKKSVL
jgi:hypothetical protein